jgi:hypothetical protein
MGHYALPAQRELFPNAAPMTLLPPVMQRLLILIEQLLKETVSFEISAMERDDEQQDHA